MWKVKRRSEALSKRSIMLVVQQKGSGWCSIQVSISLTWLTSQRAHRFAAVEQERVGLVEDQHGLRLARALEGLGDVLLRLADIGREQIRGALLQDLEPEPARDIASEGRFPRPGRS